MIYFDHNASSPLLPEAAQVWQDAAAQFTGNPSSPHRLGARADAALGLAREKLATALGCDALDLVWTSGATESNNAVLHHFSVTLPARAELWLSAIEHPCVIESARHYFPKRHRFIPITPAGTVDVKRLEESFARKRPGLVAVMAVNNETGILQPWREVLALCQKHRVPFFCDATQWLGRLPATGLGECDYLAGSAHKFGGPRGVGFLKVAGKGRFEPLLHGGPQEEGRRAGTENVAGVLAMLAAFEHREALIARGEHEARARLRERFCERLLAALPGAEIIGLEQPCVWNTVSALMPRANCQQRWVVKLDKLGLAVSTGSACASGKEKPSHVLSALGYIPADASRALRFSSGWETSEADWSVLLDALKKVHGAMGR